MTRSRAPSVRYRIAMFLYQSLLAALEPLVWGYFRKRGAGDPAYLEHWDERRGQGATFEADIWIHVVSLGEFRSAEPVLRLLLDAGHRLVLTHATPAGRRASEEALADEISAGRVAVRYAPIDRHKYWARFFAAQKPNLGLVFEMEFWPGMIGAASAKGVALWLVNSQVPEKSFRRARAIKALLGDHPVALASATFAKSERMADRFRHLGADTVQVMGETRFDIAPPAAQVAAGAALAAALEDRSVYTFASVVAGEEDVYLAATRDVVAAQNALVVWVPRAPEAFETTPEMLAAADLTVARRSVVFGTGLDQSVDLSDIDVLVGDSFGEMFFYLAAADVVSVGGGFVEKGAHNVIEPLALGKPAVTGPHVWTIEFPGVEAAETGVLHTCAPGDLALTLRRLQEQGPEAARAFHAAHVGASERLVSAVSNALGEPK